MTETVKQVLFVCLGNICRSPTAHGVFEVLVAEAGLSSRVKVDSAGTAAYHVGGGPDQRSAEVARRHGYPLDHLRARQVDQADFQQFDYILAMDNANLAELRRQCPQDFNGHLGHFLDFSELPVTEVPDPYYGGDEGFEHVLQLVESASRGLIAHLQQELRR